MNLKDIKKQFGDWYFIRQENINDGKRIRYRYFSSWKQFYDYNQKTYKKSVTTPKDKSNV